MSRRILVIEDHEENRRILRDLFTIGGYEVIEATTGLEGVSLAEERPDLIIMDVQLPGIDGYEATPPRQLPPPDPFHARTTPPTRM